MVKYKKRLFKQAILDQLNGLSERNSKQYWQLVNEIKELKNQSSNSCLPISPED